MRDTIRDAAAGTLVRMIVTNKFLRYPEELPGFRDPYLRKIASTESTEKKVSNGRLAEGSRDETDETQTRNRAAREDRTRTEDEDSENFEPLARISALQTSMARSHDAEDSIILVDWYTEDDPANPRNWSRTKKTVVCGEICLLTFAVFLGSSSYAASIPGVVEQFHTSETVASLGLALYVMAYGVGALVWSPLSEIAVLGRNSLYIGTFFIFTVLLIPTAITNSLPGLLVLRFLGGWFASPCLSTGPASFSDMLPFSKLPYVIALWSSASYLAPAIGPIVAAFAIEAKDWHWSLLELLWLASPLFILVFIFLPETSVDNILLRRASRLRRVTGNPNFKSQSEINQAHMSAKQIAFDALIKPWEINALDPAILFSTVYVALCYAIFYTFFEVFPLVFQGIYRFSPAVSALAFISFPLGLLIAIPIQLFHFAYVVGPYLLKHGNPTPEFWLKVALVVNFLAPVGLFIFAWTSRASIHWAVPLLGVVLFQAGSIQIVNSLFAYIPNIHPKYAASLFAANAAARSCLAAGAILFSRPMFARLGVGGGISLLAGLMCLCSVLLYVLFLWGAALRKRSRFFST